VQKKYFFLRLLVDCLAKLREMLFNHQNSYMPTPNPRQSKVTLSLQKVFTQCLTFTKLLL